MKLLDRISLKFERQFFGLKNHDYSELESFFTNKTGLEIGGPSSVFKADNLLPIYAYAKRVDGVNFSNSTVWENTIREGLTYDYGNSQPGYQFIAEASHLPAIADNTYDFLLSSHSLEHCANTIKTLNEWKRVVAPGGYMIIIVPDKRLTFDHKRKTTQFAHLLDDYQQDVNESDLTHLDEILVAHDIDRDPGAIDAVYFRERSLRNLENRCLHHHVFDRPLLIQALKYANLNVLSTHIAFPIHIIAIVQKPLV
ncbi:methyltransferase domain-containing protein [Spirosoma sp. KUDC1026]|uniref:methyltransferase domain-containing protein n=1 Tax=Spirosoma sp. KUDC1026 TaxID=2745947 RepID=UPI00159BD1CE|nr:class I SAM-dependent methyltransferase [Spirosoma sp. KUDC1026]QKZ12356.1 class I SAM-dependent methyltransferase [Spirosoma sp. KUDC1026]